MTHLAFHKYTSPAAIRIIREVLLFEKNAVNDEFYSIPPTIISNNISTSLTRILASHSLF